MIPLGYFRPRDSAELRYIFRSSAWFAVLESVGYLCGFWVRVQIKIQMYYWLIGQNLILFCIYILNNKLNYFKFKK